MEFSHYNINCKYFKVKDFSNCYSDSNEILLTRTRIRSFSKNAEEYIAYVNRLNIKAEIMCIAGIQFRQDSITEITRYNLFQVYRNNVGNGGGISIHMGDKYKSVLLTDRSFVSDVKLGD